ncbi:SMP-30/gluconolactonase/LRE family protein [Microbulbifer sp. SA54]|uniref:SMP-30/gluconolactonase/LRE family protein n=1 Tax=Microbulbifer sp. SA54 TaxID=3401577 RepID=UPI003AADB285
MFKLSRFHYCLPGLLALSIQGCVPGEAESSIDTRDWMPQGSFTTGIEGPASGPDGSLYVVNYEKQGTIGKISGESVGELWLQLPGNSVGNSIRFNQQGEMFVADYVGHNIFRIDSNSGEILQTYHNPDMHQPNDLALAANGTIYASDPSWSTNSGQLWRLDTDGTFTLLEKDMGTTNGIELSPDNKKLYVNESVQRTVYVYDVLDSGDLANKQLFMQFDDHGLDGMKTDTEGNLYITRYGAGVVLKVSPEGEVLRTIHLQGQHPTNIAFSLDGRSAFVTMQKRGAIEHFSTKF